jgi:hypothetical protein
MRAIIDHLKDDWPRMVYAYVVAVRKTLTASGTLPEAVSVTKSAGEEREQPTGIGYIGRAGRRT